jgi:hypothetical protein
MKLNAGNWHRTGGNTHSKTTAQEEITIFIHAMVIVGRRGTTKFMFIKPHKKYFYFCIELMHSAIN